ncbi:metallo-beta-lactamase domain-containing protein 1, partial [Melanerpes formicivorus]|uniref:metallo-beta-lactamase domain-containing protein 1 n=1 Tax=Melanerpes formicivorus TaxID=211600 RepID=UPI00358FE314
PARPPPAPRHASGGADAPPGPPRGAGGAVLAAGAAGGLQPPPAPRAAAAPRAPSAWCGGGPVTALVDTGGPWGRRRLLQLLGAQGLTPADVTHVVVTHGHSDHVGNINLFPQATLVVGLDLSRGEGLYLPHGMGRGLPYPLHPGLLEVVPTPGHTPDHVSLLLRGTSLGTVLVAGDLFEREEDEEEWRALSQDQARQEQSRSWALATADVIVPGHGAPFRVLRAPGRAGEARGEGEGGIPPQ